MIKLKHDLIKPFSLPGLVKDFPVENIFNAKVTSWAYFLRWDERLYHDLYFDYISIVLGNDRQSHGIRGNPRENWLPWSCSDIFCIHNISHKKRIANQYLSITTIFVSWRSGKERCVIAQNGSMGDQFPTRSADYCVVTKGASPQRS